MRNTGNLQGISFELFIVRTCQATLLLIILVIPAGAQTRRRSTEQGPTPTRTRHQATFADEIKRCLTRSADAVMTAQKNASGHYSGQVDSTGVTYANDDCKYFIVDVILPAGFKVGGPTTMNSIRISGEFSDMWAFTQNNCTQASFRTIVSQLQGGGSFNERHRSYSRGQWTGNDDLSPCRFFSEGRNYLEVNLPEGGVGNTRTYRVLVSPKLNGQPRQARVKWGAVEVAM